MPKEDKTDILQDLFLREKPAKILLGMKTAKAPVYATVLSKAADCTYSHTIKILDILRDKGLVTFEKRGRIKRVILTDDGWDVAHNMEAMIKKLAQIEENYKKREKKVEKKPEKKE